MIFCNQYLGFSLLIGLFLIIFKKFLDLLKEILNPEFYLKELSFFYITNIF